MIRNYLTIAWRNLVRNKGYALINISGLATGMAVAILIGLYIYDELSWNKNFKNYNRIARVLVNNENSSGWYQQWGTATPLAGEIRANYGGDFDHVLLSSQGMTAILSSGDTRVTQDGYYFEPGVVDMLSFEMIRGSRNGLRNPESVMLSASAAKALFGNDDALNKSVSIDGQTELIVTGVYKDIPANSDFNDMRFVLPWQLAVQKNFNNNNGNQWDHNGFITWAQITDKTDMAAATSHIKDVMLKRVDAGFAKNKPQLYLHPMSRWRLYSDFESPEYASGRIRYIWLYGIIGCFVLVLACINFMNLATARSEKRAKEVGIRKSVGSARKQLVTQFFSESLLVTLLAFCLSLVLSQLALPLFNGVAEKQMQVPWGSAIFWLSGLTFVAFTGLCAGSYPALYLSSFQPAKVLKGGSGSSGSGSLPRKVLVVLQFSVSITLIIGVIVVFRQIEFGKSRSLGYDQDRLIYTWTPTREIHNHYEVLRHELLGSGVVTSMAESQNTPTRVGFHIGGYDWNGTGGDEGGFGTAWVSPDFGKTMGWNFIAGRDFSYEFASDSNTMILNESAVKFMHLEQPIGHTVRSTIFDKTTSYTVIGVIHDMLQESPFEPVGKTIYMFDKGMWSKNGGTLVNLRINPRMDTHEALAQIERVWKRNDPSSPFQFTFVDADYARKFSEEERIAKLAFVFAAIAIMISCLGILGLASYMAERRTREIGIRKVLGATVASLWALLSKDFVVLVLISSAIAIPVAWYFMNGWLQNYSYKTNLSWYIFTGAAFGSLVMTVLTVSYQAIKAAIANPVQSLRAE
jgi:ABC-type antimicrobial peptide transport system permease subunit